MDQKSILKRSVLAYLDSQNWKYRPRGDNGEIIEVGMNIGGMLNNCKEAILVSDDGITCAALSPVNASPENFGLVAEYITRANYGLKIGNFEMDYRDGEVRYCTYLPATSGVPDPKDVEHVVDLPFLMMHRYGNGLAKAIMGFGNPEQDIAEAEK